MEEIVYLNGSLVPRSEALISVDDHGFLYGYGLFETMRAYNGKIFLLDRHLTRLQSSARAIRLDASFADIDLAKACIDTLKANGLREARLRLTVTRGKADSFASPVITCKPTVLVTARSYSAMPEEIYNKGYRVGISSFGRYSQSILSGHKSTNFLNNILAKMEAEASGLDESLLLNENGCFTEGSISNIFFISSDSSLVTPSLQSGILPGITRMVVMELAGSNGISITEKDVKSGELINFKEAFLTNSVMEIMPLVEVRERTGKTITIGSGKPGSLTKRLMAAYKKLVERETG